MSADNKIFLSFMKIFVGLPGTHCSYSRRIYNTRGTERQSARMSKN